MAELVLGALCAIVGALVVVVVPDASAAGLLLCVLGAVCAVAGLMRAPTLGTWSSGHDDAAVSSWEVVAAEPDEALAALVRHVEGVARARIEALTAALEGGR